MRRPKKRMPILDKLGLFADGCARKPPIGTVRLCRQFALTTVALAFIVAKDRYRAFESHASQARVDPELTVNLASDWPDSSRREFRSRDHLLKIGLFLLRSRAYMLVAADDSSILWPRYVRQSMTRSARRRMDRGIAMPSALAALALTTSSNEVGCSTGMSAGLTPLSTLSTTSAERRC